MTPSQAVSTDAIVPLYLDQTGDGVIGAIKGLSPAQWSFKPAPDRWSIAQIVEHVVVVQDLVLGPVRGQLATAPPAAGQNAEHVDDIVLHRFPDRTVKFKAPEAAQPGGALPLEAAIGRLVDNSARLAEYFESTPDLRQHAVDAPPLKAITNGVYEKLDGCQWVLAAAAHTERHTKQILELKADPAFPLE